LEDCENKMKI